MVRLRALFVSAAILAAVAATAVPRAHAAPPPPPPCFPDSAQQNAVNSTTPPSTGPNVLSTAHFDVWYNSDPTASNYMTQTQAGDLAAFAEQAYSAYTAQGFPAPLVDGSTGKSEIYVIDLKTYQLASLVCYGSFYYDSNEIGQSDEEVTAGWDVFTLVEESVGGADPWFGQAASEWAAARLAGYPPSVASDVGPFEMSIDCFDPNYDVGMAECSKNGYEDLALSRWPFEEYLAEKFGTSFILEALRDGVSAGDSMTGLENALAAHGTSLAAEYDAYTTKLMVGGWTALDLDSITIPISGNAILTGTTTGDTASQSFSVDHLATRFVEFDRGGGSGANACYAAKLTVNVQLPAGVTTQPVFYWNGTSSSPVPLTINGNTATTTVPWDTCQWSNKALLSLPNATTNVDGATFVVSAHLAVDFTTPASSALPPAQVSQYGSPVNASTYPSTPDLSLYGPAVISVGSNDTTLQVSFSSTGNGNCKVTLGDTSLGSFDLYPGADTHAFTLSSSVQKTLQQAGSGGLTLTLTPFSPDGSVKGTAIKRTVVLDTTKASLTAKTSKWTAKAKSAKTPKKPTQKKTSRKRA